MNININDSITTELVFVPKKNKTDNSKYCIYLSCGIYEKGIRQFNPSISTGINIKISEWTKGGVSGRTDRAKLINDQLHEILSVAKDLLQHLSIKKIKTCSELMKEITGTIRQRITGKAPRGYKNQFISKLGDYTYENIMQAYLAFKQPCKQRQIKYPITNRLLKEYFTHIPNIDMITTEEMSDFRRWFLDTYKVKPNTVSSYCYMITAVFNHAVRLKIINVSPLPKGFV